MDATLKWITVFTGLITILLGVALNLTVPVVVDYVINFMPEQFKESKEFNAYFLAFAYFIANAVFIRIMLNVFCEEKFIENTESSDKDCAEKLKETSQYISELKSKIIKLEDENKWLNVLVEKQQERIEKQERYIRKLKSKLKGS